MISVRDSESVIRNPLFVMCGSCHRAMIRSSYAHLRAFLMRTTHAICLNMMQSLRYVISRTQEPPTNLSSYLKRAIVV